MSSNYRKSARSSRLRRNASPRWAFAYASGHVGELRLPDETGAVSHVDLEWRDAPGRCRR